MEPAPAKPAPAEPAILPPPMNPAARRLTRGADGVVHFIARHWLALFNIAWATYVLLPFAAAILMHAGLEAPARVLYTLYSFVCHQLPDHSYFLFGPNLAPNDAALIAGGMPATPDLFVQRKFIGSEVVGYKVALCQRDVAIYGSVLVSGLIFAVVRKRLRHPVRPLPLKFFLLAMIPMAIDGGTQLFGLRTSNWWLRTLTGTLFGAAAVWWAYPYIDEAMDDVLTNEAPAPPPGPA